MRKQIYCLLSFLWISCLSVSAADRWAINSAGGITWQVDERVPHEDHIEMSGLRVSTVLRYGVDANGAFMLNRSMVWPMLRTIPNNTHASLMRRFAWNVTDMVEVNGQSLLNEKVKEVTLNGTMVVQSEYTLPRKGKLGLTRILFPSVSNPAFCEKYILRNIGESAISVEIPSSRSVVETDAAKGVDGSYKLVSTINGQVARQLQPGEELTFSATFAGYKKDERELSLDIDRELQARQDFGITWFWIRPILSSIQCSPLQKSVERKVFTIRKEALCMAPEANPTMLLSGQTTRRNISTLSSLIWDMRSETVPHCARMNILPAS